MADVVEESENRVLKSLGTVVTAVDVTEEATKLGLTAETVTKEVSKVLKSSKIDEAQPEKGKARPVFIVKLYLSEPYKKARDINDTPEVDDAEVKSKDTVAPGSAPSSKETKQKKNARASKPKTEDDLVAGYLHIRIADLAKIERLGDRPVSVNSFERLYPFQARPRSKVKEAVVEVLIGKTFKHDFRGAVKAARASGAP